MRRAKIKTFRWAVALASALALIATLHARSLFAWGDAGHRLTAQAAAAVLPAEMPAFFRNAAAQLAY